MKLLIPIFLVMATLPFHPLVSSAASCGGSCATLDDCDGQLVCNDGKCGDDPKSGTQVCTTFHTGKRPSPPASQACRPLGTLRCGTRSFPRFHCSPPVTSSTRATLSNNDFDEGGSGGSPSECDGRFHSNSEPVVALSTGWYDGGSRCGKKIRITSEKTGRTVLARVVDECDSMNGCDDEHASLPPCRNDIVDGSNAVWKALGLDVDVGLEDITWSMAI